MLMNLNQMEELMRPFSGKVKDRQMQIVYNVTKSLEAMGLIRMF